MMHRKNWMLLALVAIFGFLIIAGGCGGGGGSSDVTPTPPSTNVEFSVLSGTWTASNGSGTASGNGVNLSLKLITGSTSIDVLSTATDKATAQIDYNFDWGVYSGGALVEEIVLSESGGYSTVERTGSNSFRYTFPDGERIDITMTSNTTATVKETGAYSESGYSFQYEATYSMEKTSGVQPTPTPTPEPEPEPEPPAISNWIDVADTSWYEGKTQDETFTISTAEQLAGLAKLTNDGAQDFSDRTIALAADIDLAGREWTPIAHSYSSSFQGTFDGGAHTISNLTIETEDSINYYGIYGLFGFNSGTIKNINLTGVYIDVSSPDSSPDNYYSYAGSVYSYAGSVVGYNYGTLTDCDASGNISSYYSAGGIVGLNDGGLLTDCDANVDVSSSSSITSSAGGIAGLNTGTMTGCDASGNVSSSSFLPPSYPYTLHFSSAGGIVGRNDGALTDCDASGNVSSSSSLFYNCYAGGIVGGNNGALMGCAASGRVTASSDNPDGVRAGGFAGKVESDSTLSGNTWDEGKSGQPFAIGLDERKDTPGPSDDID